MVERAAAVIPIGITHVGGAFAAEGWEVLLDDRNTDWLSDERFLHKVQEYAPDLIGVSLSFTAQATNALKMVSELKARFPATPLLVGGTHATFVPAESLNAGADFIALYEAEETMRDLARALANHEDAASVAGLALMRNGEVVLTPARPAIRDLDSIPSPVFTGLPLSFYANNPYPLIAGRGCNYSCYFCASPGFIKGSRYRSVDHVMAEIERARALGFKTLGFADDNLASNRERFLELCERLKPLQMPWEFNAFSMELDLEMLTAAAASACRAVRIGVESGSNRVLKVIKAGSTTERFEEMVGQAVSLGMRPICGFMFPHHNDTVETVEETRAFMRKLNAMGAQTNMNLSTPFPGSRLWKHPKSLKIEIKSTNWDEYDVRTPTFTTEAFPTLEEIQKIFATFEDLQFENATNIAMKVVKNMGLSIPPEVETLIGAAMPGLVRMLTGRGS